MKILLLIIAFSTSYSVSAQNAKEISTKYNRVVVPGVEITFRNSKDVVKSALNDYLEKELKEKSLVKVLTCMKM